MSEPPAIDLRTISRIFHELSFKHEDTRISEKALELSSQYIRLFINEAILRANEERLAEGDTLNKVDGIDNVDENLRTENKVTEAEVPDITIGEEDEELSSNPPTQFDQPGELDNNTLDTRHLSKVVGVLMLDF